MKTITTICVSALVGALSLGTLQAQGFLGETVTSQYYAFGGPYNGSTSPTTFVANGTVQQTFGTGFPEGFNLTVSASQITYDFLYNNGYWSTSDTSLNSGGLFIANGNLVSSSGVSISGVSVDAATTLPGFVPGDVTFNANNVAVDWAGITGISAGNTVVLDVTFSSVPEPSSSTLVLMGLAAFSMVGFKRMRKAQS